MFGIIIVKMSANHLLLNIMKSAALGNIKSADLCNQ